MELISLHVDTLKNNMIRPQKAQNGRKKAKNKNSENEKSYRIKVISLNELTPKNFSGPHPSPKNSLIGPQKPQNDPKKQKIKKSENKKAYKKKVICQYKQSPKNFSDPISTPKLAR